MSKTPKLICGAPCIIHNDHGFTALFCVLEKFHEEASHTSILGEAKVIWRYRGVSEALRKKTVPSSRCRGRVGITGVRQALDLGGAPLGVELHYFNCEESVSCRHGTHVRSGMYEPLGVEWAISWPCTKD